MNATPTHALTRQTPPPSKRAASPLVSVKLANSDPTLEFTWASSKKKIPQNIM